jgi:uncharacterized protein with von Willebrand factor type A (vWA) domain
MNPDDLNDLLGLNDPLPDFGPDEHYADDGAEEPVERHENAIEMDEWGQRRGRELTDCPRWEATKLSEAAAADCFAAAFDPTPRLQPCEDRFREQFLTALLETPDYLALHAETMLDDFAAQIAALHFGDELAKASPKPDEKPSEAKPGEPDGEMKAALAAGKGAAAAAEEVKEYCDAREAGLGMGEGAPGERRNPKAIAEAYKRLRNNPSLRRIAELAGRFRRVAQSKQRMKTVHGFDDVVGVEMGGDVARLLPHELAKLAIPELELDTLRRIAERQSLCRDYEASEPAGKGPIIITLDESGSMHTKIDAAKGVALALAWVARQQKRWCAIVAYSGGSGERIIALPPGRWDEAALCDWLPQFIGGGSNIDVPIAELPRIYADLKPPAGVTDVVMITDAICRLPSALVDRFDGWKRGARARVISLIVGDEPGDLRKVSDECHVIQSINTEEAAIGRVLSI